MYFRRRLHEGGRERVPERSLPRLGMPLQRRLRRMQLPGSRFVVLSLSLFFLYTTLSSVSSSSSSFHLFFPIPFSLSLSLYLFLFPSFFLSAACAWRAGASRTNLEGRSRRREGQAARRVHCFLRARRRRRRRPRLRRRNEQWLTRPRLHCLHVYMYPAATRDVVRTEITCTFFSFVLWL